VILRYGFMEQPDVPRDLAPLADRGVPFDPMRTSYFVGRNSFVEASRPLLPRWQEKLFLVLARVASNAGDFFQLPPTASSSWAAASKSRSARKGTRPR